MNNEEIARRLSSTLNVHGHGFQYAVARHIFERPANRQFYWTIDGMEVPVAVRGQDIHIDIVLRSNTGRFYIVIECKRVNPARSLWAFIRASAKKDDSKRGIFEWLAESHPPGTILRATKNESLDSSCYEIGVALKTQQPGDAEPSGPVATAINDAVTQALRGTSGFMNHVAAQARGSSGWQNPVFIPIVVTTAQLWGCPNNLRDADLHTGEIDPAALGLQKEDFLWLSTNRSRSLISDVEPAGGQMSYLRDWLSNEATRTIGIATVDGLDNFLSLNLADWFT